MSYFCRTVGTNLIVDTKKICPMFQLVNNHIYDGVLAEAHHFF